MIARADLKPGEHVLEIGCGWGACAMRMAEKAGVLLNGITVSQEQLAEAKARVAAAGKQSNPRNRTAKQAQRPLTHLPPHPLHRPI